MNVDAELAGYAEVRGMYQVGVEGTPWTLIEKVRPTFEINAAPRVRAFVAVDGTLVEGRDTSDELRIFLESTELGPTLEEYCTPVETYHFEDVRDYLTVERLYVDFTGKKVDFRVGRQPVNWGSALVFHPTDLYNEVVASEPWRERKGVNALRAKIAPVPSADILALVAMDDDLSAFEKAEADELPDFEDLPFSGAVKLTLRKFETDWSAVGLYRADGRWFAGGDLRGTLGVGWWVEGGWHGDAREVDPEGAEVVVGVDYSLPILARFYVAAEYRYDGTGEEDPEEYDYSLRSAGAVGVPYSCPFATAGVNVDPDEVQPTTRTTLGQHYVDATMNVQFLDDWTVGGVAIVNVQDGTGLVVPDVAVTLGERVAVHVGAQIPVGEDGEFVPPDETFDVSAGNKSANLAGFVPVATLNAWARYSF